MLIQKHLKKFFRKIIFAIKTDREYWGYTASAAVYEFIMQFHKLASVSQKEENPENDILQPVLEYIDDNYMKVIELTDLCNIMKVTPQYLCRVFKKYEGISPGDYQKSKLF